jgi:Rps23 Pro-64 3,4-dihydroxylase Tpa1-like proline 4-hydroxylase
VDPSQRVSLHLPDIAPIKAWFLPLVRSRLAEMIARCDVTPFTPGEIETRCTAYADGAFFKTHSDNLYHVTRRLSFVYYFHRTPKPYTGGDLLLYDAEPEDASHYFSDRFTRIETRDNSLIVFPSELFHEVTRVVSPSSAFADSRFTLNGHIHARAETPATDE